LAALRFGSLSLYRLRKLAIREFDTCLPSHAFQRSANLPKRPQNGPEIPAFRALPSVSRLPLYWSGVANLGKSPTVSANIPVLRRLSAETGSIRTATRPWQSV